MENSLFFGGFRVAEPPPEGGPHLGAIGFKESQRRLMVGAPKRCIGTLAERRIPPRVPHVRFVRFIRLDETLLGILPDRLKEVLERFATGGVGDYQ